MKRVLPFVSPLLVASCIGSQQGNPVVSVLPSVQPVATPTREIPTPMGSSSPVPSPVSNGPFDIAPNVPPENAAPGQITILFRDEYRVRVVSNKTVSAKDEAIASQINSLFSRYDVKLLSPGDPNSTEEQASASEQRSEAAFGGDQPNAKSFCYAIFPENIDIEAVIDSFRSLPAVRIVYRTPKVSPAS